MSASCLQIPLDTERMRNFLFEMPVPFSMRADVFERYWPMVDNIWSRYDEINVTGRDKIPYNSIRFACRFARKLEGEPSRSTNKASKRQRREGGTCTCRVKAKFFHGLQGVPDHYRFEHSSPKECDWVHSHTIDESDSIKINSFLKAAAAVEAAKGYMPADIYKNMRSVQLLDLDGGSLGDALDAAGGKFMTRMHANNAKQSALSSAGGKFSTRQHVADVRNSLKRPHPEERVAHLAEIISIDPATIWPETLGRTADDQEEHARIIKNDIRSLVESIAIGGRATVPRDVLVPLLNSVAAYMDKSSENVDGKTLLEAIVRVQEQCGMAPPATGTLPNIGFVSNPSSHSLAPECNRNLAHDSSLWHNLLVIMERSYALLDAFDKTSIPSDLLSLQIMHLINLPKLASVASSYIALNAAADSEVALDIATDNPTSGFPHSCFDILVKGNTLVANY
ncbi:hypothetical protein LSUE1_G000599 [Lachnellula suecica]|uniref:Uncharacterized protein n=1 Tax=Lachnellula suecica TaxID=602035 RepID=A0A8T9CQ89_9HELO|nr:hypothetical protein LSUE1_G000599 [Lachnellula suecica]